MFDKPIKYKRNNKVLTVNPSHLHQHPEMNDLLGSAFTRFLSQEQNYPEKVIKVEIKMGKVVGQTICVKTDESSEIFYAQRKGRNTFSRFIKNIEPQDCDTVTLVMSRGKENTFHLVTAYVGYKAEKEPLDPTIKTEKEFLECKEFWEGRALVENSQSIYRKTITEVCPWDSFDNRPVIKFGDKNNVVEIIAQMRKDNITEKPSNELKK